MSEERDLIKKRGSFKGRLTAFVTFLDSLKDKVLSSCDVSELQLRMGKMESLYEQYDEVQLRLECISDDIKESSVALKGLIDQLNKDLRALESLGEPVKHWDTFLIYHVTQKIDHRTYREWEEFKGRIDKESSITFDMFMQFLRTRADLIENLERLRTNNNSQTAGRSNPRIKSMLANQSNNSSSIETAPQVNKSILGINNVTSHVGKTCRVKMSSLDDSFNYDLHCLVLPFITSEVPSREIKVSYFDLPSNISLADPMFYKPADIDLLIGADLFWELLGSQRLHLGTGKPILYETRLGWIVSGPITQYCSLPSNNLKCYFSKGVSDDDCYWDKLRTDLTKFWQLEEVSLKSSNSYECYMPEERLCEDNFVKNTTRLPSGRFCVRIPLKKDPSILGASYKKATHCFQSLERRLKNNSEFACMPLRKWRSNNPKLALDGVSASSDFPAPVDLDIASHEPDKLLGLGWYVAADELGFPISLSKSSAGHTKRDLLSVIARIFDPLGLLCPIILTMKVLLQKLWLDKLSWDQPLPDDIKYHWNNILKSLPLLPHFRIPRIVVCNSYREIELHIFSDASEAAYGACVYVRSVNDEGKYSVSLLMAKSRVAPIKPTTIPRLELCGAVIGSRLYDKVKSSLRVEIGRVYCWTDSTIVLGWLQMMPTKLQPFVRNRVAEVLDKAGNCTWRHVPTDKNPADLISRGVDIGVLRELDLWWSGPDFLQRNPSEWPSKVKCSGLELLPETRCNLVSNAVIKDTVGDAFIEFNRYSDYSRLVRSVAYILRFIKSSQTPAAAG
ncbi:hypothetical protein HF086_007325 [Spodoptera exigua]|uniref:Peptidase aspartic putative domain-containing protein n=1 Tax=Spodoptera exigua TaxID=7107 RepID=A0A922MPW7_SPOEX|nr:hypothetical protein HF086_007325 [Spodoptera exigua]